MWHSYLITVDDTFLWGRGKMAENNLILTFSKLSDVSSMKLSSRTSAGNPGENSDLSAACSPLSQFSSVQSLSCVQLFVTPWTAACQASLFITNSQSLLKLMSIELVPSAMASAMRCHPAISSSVVPFSSCPQSLPASGFFQWVSSLHQVAKVLELQLQHQSFQWIFRTGFL